MKKLRLVLLALVCVTHGLRATDYTWTGGAAGDGENWYNPTNWGKTVVGDYPKSTADKAIFSAGASVTAVITNDITVYQVTFGAGCSVTLKSGVPPSVPMLKANNAFTDSGIVSFTLDGVYFYRAADWTPTSGSAFTLVNGAQLFLNSFNMNNMTGVSLAGGSWMSVNEFRINGTTPVLTLDDSTFIARGNVRLGTATPGGGHFVFKGANPVFRSIAGIFRADPNNSGMTNYVDFDFEVPAGGFAEPPVQVYGVQAFRDNGSVPAGRMRFTVLDGSPALAAEGATDCALLLDPRGIVRSRVSNGDEGNGAMRFTDGSPNITVDTDAAAAIYVTVGSGSAADPAAVEHGSLLGYTATTVARHVITATGWMTAIANQGATTTLELWAGESSSTNTMALASTCTPTSIGPWVLSFTAPEDCGEKTFYLQFRVRDLVGGATVFYQVSTVFNNTTRDTTTYTWKAKAGVWAGNWDDPGHWATDYDTLKGYPYTSASTVQFPPNQAITVMVTNNFTVGTLNLASGNLDVTFQGGDLGTNVTLTASTLDVNGFKSTVTLDNVKLSVANNISLGFMRLLLKNSAYLYTANFYNVSDGSLEITDGAYMNCGYLQLKSSRTTLIIDDGTLYMRGDIEIAHTSVTLDGGTVYFRGTHPVMRFINGTRPYLRANGTKTHPWIFEIPAGGFDAPPIQCEANQASVFPAWYKNGKLLFTVSEASPCYAAVGTFDCPLLAWRGTSYVSTNQVVYASLPGPDAAGSYFMYGASADASGYGWAKIPDFTGTVKAIGVHIVNAAHDDRVTVKGDPAEAVAGCAPTFGTTFGHAVDEELAFSAPASEVVGGVRYTCTGYTLVEYAAGSYTATNRTLAGATNEFTFTFAGKGVEVTWHFAVDYQITTTVMNDAAATVAASVDGGFVSETVPCTFTPTTTDDTMEFQYWYGDVPFGKRFDNPLTLTASKGGALYAFFGRKAGSRIVSTGGNSAVNWYDAGTWTGGVIPGTNDTAILLSTYTTAAGTLNQGGNGRRLFVPSYFAVGNLVNSNAIVYVNVPNSSGLNRDNPDGYGNYTVSIYDATDTTRAEPVGFDVFGDVLLDSYNKSFGNNAGVLIVGGSGQRANTRISIGGDLAISNGYLSVAAGVALDPDWFYPAKSGSGPDYRVDYPNTDELFRGGNYLRVGGRTTVGTADAVNFQNAIHLVNDYVSGAAVWLDLQDVEVGEGSAITCYNSGYSRYSTGGWTYSMNPGGTDLGDNTAGGSYGGRGGSATVVTGGAVSYYTTQVTYGWENAPIHPGGPNGGNGKRGGGSIRLDCGRLVLNGMLNAHGGRGSGNKGSAAGGGIWVCCSEFVPGDNCMISVRGGTWDNGVNSGGGGGRASLCVGLDDTQIMELYTNSSHTAAEVNVSPLSAYLTSRFSAEGGAKGGDRTAGEAGTGVYIVNTAGKKTMVVSGIPYNYGAPEPAYGTTVFDEGAVIGLAAPANAFVTDDCRSRRVCVGYTITNASNQTLVQSEQTSGTFTINEDCWLTWDLAALEHEITTFATAGGSITTNALPRDDTDWQPDGATVTFTAVADAGYVFKGWYGDVATNWIRSAQISFAADRGRALKALFEPTAAGSRDWTGEGDGVNWTDPANWSPAGLPGIAEAVTITNGAVVADLCAEIEVGSLTIGPDATLTFKRTDTAFSTFTKLLSEAVEEDFRPTALKVNGDLTVFGSLAMGASRYSASQFDLAVGGSLQVMPSGQATLYAGYDAVSYRAPASWKRGGGRVTVGGELSIATNAVVKAYAEGIWGATTVFKVGSMTIAAGGRLDAEAAGWTYTYIRAVLYCGSPQKAYNFGSGTIGYQGGTYGGWGGYSDTHNPCEISYGEAYAPFMPGSPGMNTTAHWGGGALTVFAKGTIRIFGTVNANGANQTGSAGSGGAGSGGSVWLVGTLVKTSSTTSVTAKGGTQTTNGNGGAGGGGRICIASGLKDSEVDELYALGTCDGIVKGRITVTDLTDGGDHAALFSGTISAQGGVNERTYLPRRYSGTEGTAVWLTGPAAGTLIILR